jgi:hypothetical protein
MKIKLAVAACVLLSNGSVMAADQPESNQPAIAEQAAPSLGFGSGTGIGSGGIQGSSLGDGFSSPVGNGGAGTQSFGAGFTPQQAASAGFTLPNTPLTSLPPANPLAGGALGLGR